MTRKILVGIILLVPLAFAIVPAWGVGPPSQPEQLADPQMRQREGGRPVLPQDQRAEGQEGTEDGLPAPSVESFGQRERFRPMPHWRLGVFAYNTTTGVVVTQVIPGSPAARARFEPGDRIVAVSGYQVGFVGNQLFSLGEELQRQADRRGIVLILGQNVRNRQLLNLDVQLEPRRFGEPLGARVEPARP